METESHNTTYDNQSVMKIKVLTNKRNYLCIIVFDILITRTLYILNEQIISCIKSTGIKSFSFDATPTTFLKYGS